MDESEQYKITNFTNIDSEDYVGMWGGKEETIKAHATVQLVKFLADHYAFHLAKKILIKEGQDFGDAGLIKEQTDKILGQVVVSVPMPEATTTTAEEFEDLVKEEVVVVKKKSGRPKRSV